MAIQAVYGITKPRDHASARKRRPPDIYNFTLNPPCGASRLN